MGSCYSDKHWFCSPTFPCSLFEWGFLLLEYLPFLATQQERRVKTRKSPVLLFDNKPKTSLADELASYTDAHDNLTGKLVRKRWTTKVVSCNIVVSTSRSCCIFY